MKRSVDFATEADLCAAFIAWAKTKGFTPYAETAGWDILLVDADNRQTGIQAKMDLNLKVIAQAINEPLFREYPGPDHRAILVPFEREAARDILVLCGLSLFTPHANHYPSREETPWAFDRYDWGLAAHDWNPAKRCQLPAYIPDVPAGVPSPRTLSPWKVGALEVIATLELQGYVTRDDIRTCKNDPRRWCASDGYLASLGNGRWGRAEKTPPFHTQHPGVYAQVRLDVAKRLGKTVDVRRGRINPASRPSCDDPATQPKGVPPC